MIEDDHVIQATRRQSSQTNPSGRNRRIERIECDETPVLLCMAAGRSPWRTWRVTDAGSALDGVHEYLPESERRTWRSSSEVEVTGFVLSVTMATPPRDESCLSSWSWWCQKTYSGGSGLNWTIQVRLTWLPTSTWNSGPPKITALGAGSVHRRFFVFVFFFVLFLMQQYNINKVDWKGKQFKKNKKLI